MQVADAQRRTDLRSEVTGALNQALADTAVATMLAQNFHWNVTGPTFLLLHDLFEEIYGDHFKAQDDLAEHIKALGGKADGNLGRMATASGVQEHSGETSAEATLVAMLRAEEALSTSLKACERLAAHSSDTLTEDLCIARRQVHEKFAWMLKAHLR